MKIAVILGTRPEVIKLYPLIKVFAKKGIDYFILHTNQHYSENMDKNFFRELDLPVPKYNLNVGSHPHGKQTGRMLEGIESVLLSEKPDFIAVQGDTNTVLAGALAASKLGIKVIHVEAGLRSYDRSMPEEINRVVSDHISDYLFAPTKVQERILLSEGRDKKKIIVVGNTIVDSVKLLSSVAEEKSGILAKLGLKKQEYILVTVHRQENVDFEIKFKNIIRGLDTVAKELNKKIIYPIHPRSKKMVDTFGIKIPDTIILVDPVGYLDMIQLQKNAALVITDSGGLQEESNILQVPCVTLRENTERPETISAGGNVLAGTNPDKILSCSKEMIKKERNWKNPFGDGRTSERIADYLLGK